jgi:hypothetical protein
VRTKLFDTPPPRRRQEAQGLSHSTLRKSPHFLPQSAGPPIKSCPSELTNTPHDATLPGQRVFSNLSTRTAPDSTVRTVFALVENTGARIINVRTFAKESINPYLMAAAGDR